MRKYRANFRSLKMVNFSGGGPETEPYLTRVLDEFDCALHPYLYPATTSMKRP